ncbi:hypothetical protein QJQ45_020624 [Haematococcus lacustris]|nr:hypothetical protein QJQ45_020624 [Haematococcus lacustris]
MGAKGAGQAGRDGLGVGWGEGGREGLGGGWGGQQGEGATAGFQGNQFVLQGRDSKAELVRWECGGHRRPHALHLVSPACFTLAVYSPSDHLLRIITRGMHAGRDTATATDTAADKAAAATAPAAPLSLPPPDILGERVPCTVPELPALVPPAPAPPPPTVFPHTSPSALYPAAEACRVLHPPHHGKEVHCLLLLPPPPAPQHPSSLPLTLEPNPLAYSAPSSSPSRPSSRTFTPPTSPTPSSPVFSAPTYSATPSPSSCSLPPPLPPLALVTGSEDSTVR